MSRHTIIAGSVACGVAAILLATGAPLATAGWFERAVVAAGADYSDADEFKRDEYYIENPEDRAWFDRAVTAAGADFTDADEFEGSDE